MRGAAYFAIAAAIIGAAPSFAQSAPSATGSGAPVLGPGDAVRIEVWGKHEMSGEFPIAADSSIVHPLYRDIRAAGVPFGELEGRVREYLERYEANPQFVIEPLFQVAVGGEVRQPSLFTMRPEVTLAQALARAGGVTDRGRLDRVHLIRDGREQVLDLSRPELGYAALPVRSGDQLYVSRRVSIFREYVAPGSSVVAAAAALARLLLN